MAEVRKVACWMPSKALRRHGIALGLAASFLAPVVGDATSATPPAAPLRGTVEGGWTAKVDR